MEETENTRTTADISERDECGSKVNKEEEKGSEEEEKLGGPVFVPRLYLQRYYFVQQILIRHNAEKVVDLGSAECKISRFLVNIPTVRNIVLMDIDRSLLEMSKWCIRPMTCDYVCRREKPLNIRMFEGDVTRFDPRLQNPDAVTMIEIIEHLIPDVLDAAVLMVFGKMKPELVVMTTPNAEFNVLFPGCSGFRHWDHKFEWTRTEFQSWCADIAQRYDYEVDYSGIGEPPDDFVHLGCCSQAATFVRNFDGNISPESPSPSSECYRLIAEHDYPYRSSAEMNKDPVLSEIDFQLRQFQTDNKYIDYDDNCVVPVSTLLGFKHIKSHFTEDKLRDYLRNHGYRLSEDGSTVILPSLNNDSDNDSDSISYDISQVPHYLTNDSDTKERTDHIDDESWD